MHCVGALTTFKSTCKWLCVGSLCSSPSPACLLNTTWRDGFAEAALLAVSECEKAGGGGGVGSTDEPYCSQASMKLIDKWCCDRRLARISGIRSVGGGVWGGCRGGTRDTRSEVPLQQGRPQQGCPSKAGPVVLHAPGTTPASVLGQGFRILRCADTHGSGRIMVCTKAMPTCM